MTRAERQREMASHLAMRERDGLTFPELSKRTGVPLATLSYWACKLRRIKAANELVEVEVEDDEDRGTGITLTISGVTVCVEREFDADVLRRVISALS